MHDKKCLPQRYLCFHRDIGRHSANLLAHMFQLELDQFARAKRSTAQAQIIRLIQLLNLERDLADPASADEVACGMKMLIRLSLHHLQ